MPCSQCFLEELCHRHTAPLRNAHAFDGLRTVTKTIEAGSVLYRAHDALTAIYIVRRGLFKSVAISRDGEQKITGFRLPGETMGLEAVSEGRYFCTAIALEDSEVCAASYSQLEQLSKRALPLYISLLCALSSETWRDQEFLLLVKNMTAEQRVESFLLSLLRRAAKQDSDNDRLRLPLTQADIGSYLGLAHETVCRVLSRRSKGRAFRAHDRERALLDIGSLK